MSSQNPSGTSESSKLCALPDALGAYVHDGSSIYISGFSHLINFAAGHELIRASRRDLTLVRMTPDIVYDQLIAAGCASHLKFSYIGNPGVGALTATRRAIERHDISYTEYTHGTLLAVMRAQAAGLPFALAPALANTDLVNSNPLVREIVSPYGGEKIPVLPPLSVDVAIVHVQQADSSGNSIVWGSIGDIREAAFAAKNVIVTAEEIVDSTVIRANQDRVVVPSFVVSAVAHVPWAAHPANAQGYYGRDNRFYRSWPELAKTDESVKTFIEAEILGVGSREEYAIHHGERLRELADIGELMSATVNYGDARRMQVTQE